jgi:serine/threonine protein kinase
MDYCQGGELLSYISRNGLSAEPFAALVFGQIAAGIAHCHRSGVVHRDIKLENILFTQFPRIKITDFGLCGFITEGKLFTTFCGTACYAAPECLRRDEYDGRLSDVWSLGVLLFAMVVGEFPWDTENLGAMMKQIVTGDYALPDHVSLSCKNLIEGMLHVDPLTRFTMDQVMSHPWMALAQKSVFHFSKTVLLEGQGPVSPTRSLALLETDIRQRAPYAGPIASKSQESVKIDDPHRAPLPRVLTNLNDVPVRKVRPGAALPSQTRPRVKQVVLRKLQ